MSSHNWRYVQTGNAEGTYMICDNPGCKATMWQRRMGSDEQWNHSDSSGRSVKQESKCEGE